ncbi:hypothetical protein AALA24_02665 [Anaerovoracaceae bacterium 42-11]
MKEKPQKISEKGGSFYIAVILFLSFFMLSMIGLGNALVAGIIGVMLCTVGLAQGGTETDIWILLPLIGYNAISLVSGWMTFGDTINGFASTQSLFPIIYLLLSYLESREKRMLKRLCAGWIGITAAIGIVQFTAAALGGNAERLSGIFGNPNAMGSILVIGWFALKSCILEMDEKKSKLRGFFEALEFIVLAALALTLSMGSFAALAVGVLVMGISDKMSFRGFICMTAEIAFAMGTGILMFAAGDRAQLGWLCVMLCLYIAAAALCRGTFTMFLNEKRWVAPVMAGLGILTAGAALFLRPNAAATFGERIAMMRNGIRYLFESPLLGVGPYQWRGLNLADGDLYFNTWHIHNVLIHVGVELGLIAAVMLVLTVIRHYIKKEDAAQRGGFTAAVIHNMIDTGFFYLATVPFLMMTAGGSEQKRKKLPAAAARVIFAAFVVLFAFNIYQSLR